MSTEINIASLPGPQTITRRVFPNGAIGLAYENFTSPSVVIHGWLAAGSIDVPAEQAGLASLTASMLKRGTERRTFAQIGQEIESVGAGVGIGGGGHTTRFTAKCLVEDLGLILDILTDCLYHPTFPPEYLEKRRGEIFTALEQREHSTGATASLHFSRLMYPDHPYGLSRLGYRETIESLSREDVGAFYDQHYGAQGMVAILVGAVPSTEALDLLQDAMGTWQGARQNRAPLPAISALEEVREKRTTIPGKSQSDIVLGWLSLKRKDPDFLKVYLANCILGQFGMMGRLGQRVRDDQGLAYYVHTSLEAGLGIGPWAILAGIAPEHVERAIETVMEQVTLLREEPVSDQELEDNKAYLVGSMPLSLEGNEGVAAQIAHMELFQLGLDHMQRLPRLIEAVTAEDVMAVAQRYLRPHEYVLSVAGPEA